MLGAAPALGAAAKVGAEARGPAVYAPPQPGAVEAAVTPGMHWVEGGTTYSAYYANAGGGTGYNASWVGYYVWTDADGYPTGEFPEVGDVYYMKVAGAVIGNPWSGGFVAGFEVALPQNTSLAISTDTPLMCLLHGNDGTTYDVSNEATCTVATGVYLPISFTYYPIVSYGSYEVWFPVRSTTSLNGVSNPGSYLQGRVDWGPDAGVTVSSMPIWVPDVYVDTSITSSPPSSTTSTSASFGFTSNLTPVTYACRLDGGSWAACSSPKAYSGLATGSHTFQVAAIDSYDRVDPTPASYSWQITAPAGPATHFTVSGLTTPRTAGAAGTITVTALDASGNRATGYRGRVHFTSSDPKAVLPADFTFTATDAGRHSFSVTLKTAGSHAIRARDTVTASITGLESPIVVNPGAATTLSVFNLPSPITAGTSGSIIVRALDAYGNRATGYRGSVHFTSTDTKAVLPVDYAFTATDSGSHVFSVTLRTAGAQAIRARDKTTSTITGLQTQITVRPAAAATLTVSGLASPRTAGTVGTITVRAYDRYGNLATGYRETVHFTSTDTKATLPADHAFTASDNGVHAFSVTLRAKGSQAIRARDIVTATITGLQTGIVVQ